MTAQRIAVLVGLLAGVGSGGALAQIGPIEMVSESSVFDSTDWKQVEAECPAGTIAFSGGVSLSFSPFTDPDLPIIIHQSQPQGSPPSGWLGLAQERTATSADWAITTWALCATVSGYQLVDQSSPFDDTSPKIVSANCPAGKAPIGGGGANFVFSPSLSLSELMPTATGWRAIARGTGSWTLNVKVSCAPTVDVLRFEGRTGNDSEARDNLFLVCPADRVAVGGGGAATGFVEALYETRPRETSGIRAWEASARRITGAAWTLRGAVLCYLPPLFADGFESGDFGGWSSSAP